jgi:transcriptional regulator with XRE-family HTH domain
MDYELKLYEMREKAGMTLKQLETATGISDSELSDIERGKKDPRLSTVVILAKFYHCNLSELIIF